MYFLKTKGTELIPESVQIRDDNFALIFHVRLSNLKKKLEKIETQKTSNQIIEQIKKSEYGILKKI